jgi:hypothetical protein
MIVPYGANIWDLSSFVGVENVINVVQLTTSWDSDLSDLWVTDVPLVEQKEFEIIEFKPKQTAQNYLFVANSNQSIYDMALQLYADVSKCLQIGKGLDESIVIGEVFERSTDEYVKVFANKIITDNIIYSTDISILDTNNNVETNKILTEDINPIITEDNNNLVWI